MPDIPVGAQIFDLCFSPTSSTVFAGLLTGEVKAFGYDEQGQYEHKFTLRPSNKSCRGLASSSDGSFLWATGRGKGLHTIDTETAKIVDTRSNAHDAPINRVSSLNKHVLSTGDDEGVIKLWDMRKPDSIRSYTHHFDFISDFLYMENEKQLITTSGDGTLSVIDLRSKKTEPLAQSEDQEDELLSIVPIKGGSKFVVGTQLGILSIFNRRRGWGDCVDRIPGHPHSVDALCALPSTYPSAHSTILTGSSDGLLRVVQLFPTKLLGTVADHGDFPVERIAIDARGQGQWVGSAGHEEILKLTDLREVFEDEEEGDVAEKGETDSDASDDDGDGDGDAMVVAAAEEVPVSEEKPVDEDQDEDEDDKESVAEGESSGDESPAPLERKRKRKQDKDPLAAGKRKKGRNEVEVEGAFFADL